MEFVAYVSIGVFCFAVIVGIPGIIWLIKDNKRREQQEQEAASRSAVTQ
jgi:hypothetical protein